MIVVVVMTMLATGISSVDPPVVLVPMARDPDHFPIVIPVVVAMGVVWPIPYLDSDFFRANGGRENDARRGQTGQ
jgi:hypothetical protein